MKKIIAFVFVMIVVCVFLYSCGGSNQLVASDSGIVQQTEDLRADAITEEADLLPTDTQQEGNAAFSTDGERGGLAMQQKDTPRTSTATKIQAPDAVVTGGRAGVSEAISKSAPDDDGIVAYSVGSDTKIPQNVSTEGGERADSGSGEAGKAFSAPTVPAGTMDVYTIKTSNLSRTLSSSGFTGRAIQESGETVLILSRSEYNQLQNNIFSSGQKGNEEIKYLGHESLRNSYEWDGCFRVEITQR